MKKEILLSYFLKISYKKYQDLKKVFSSLDEAWNAPANEFKRTGWDEAFIREFFEWKNSLDEIKIQNELQAEGILCLTPDDANYPALLKQIYDPPICLFVRGALTQDPFPLGVVGPRKPSAYGRQVTQNLVSSLAEAGVTIVSGLALGIDGLAHEAACHARGKTIAVLAGGVDHHSIQPSAHRGLAQKIIELGGTIISEYPPGTAPLHYSFPKRNRIIAGMSLGTLVIEATEASGTLITAQCALDSNREVFAVPQNITSLTSVGTNNLLKMGAKLVTDSQDILEVLNLQHTKHIPAPTVQPDTPTEAKILEWMHTDPIHIDDIIKHSKMESRVVTSTLSLMEMKGKVKNLGGMMYILSH